MTEIEFFIILIIHFHFIISDSVALCLNLGVGSDNIAILIRRNFAESESEICAGTVKDMAMAVMT